ncbi:unnamed protein product, partial [Rotaria sordida]
MIQKLVDDAKERRQDEDLVNGANENEDDTEEQREINNDDYSACKRQCLQGELISHPQAKELPDAI